MTMKRWISSLLAAALCLSLLIAPAGAYTRVDTTKPVSLTLTYQYEEAAVKGLEISLYKVYDMSDAVRFTATSDFASLKGFDSKLASWTGQDGQVDWKKMATTLESLLRADGETPVAAPLLTGTTDENGVVKFESTDAVEMTAGLYLVMGETLVSGSTTYTPQTFLLTLPYLENDAWIYDLAAYGKLSVTSDPGGGGGFTTSVTVVKEWVDEDSADRPDSIQVQLLHNGSLYDTATLSAANGWKTTWSGLSASGSWTVSESGIPDNYSVDVSRSGNAFVITNTADTEIEEEEPPLDPGPGEDGDPGDLPDVDLGDDDVPLGDGDVDLGDEDVPAGSLPNTGTLWWPVQLLTAAGIVLFSIGWLDMRRNKKRENEK